MKTVLTIDFDIVMAPSIELYNNMVPSRSWKDLLNFPQMQLLTVDFLHYERLTNVLIKLFKKLDKNKVHFIEDHGQIISYLDPHEYYKIINVDHHHDCGYHPEAGKESMNCGNWVKQLSDANIIKNYVWIHNSNSHFPIEYEYMKLINKDFDFKRVDIDIDEIDEVVLCLSEPWVPDYVRPLFYTWVNLANEFYKTEFKIDYAKY